MNSVFLIGNLTRDPEARGKLTKFTIAVNSGKDKEGNDLGTDFPLITTFNKTAENCEKYLAKGRKVAVEGKLHTGSYEKEDGTRVYTTEVYADRVEFLSTSEKKETKEETPGFETLDESIPF